MLKIHEGQHCAGIFFGGRNFRVHPGEEKATHPVPVSTPSVANLTTPLHDDLER